jgi:predicted Zn-dependent peptidase
VITIEGPFTDDVLLDMVQRHLTVLQTSERNAPETFESHLEFKPTTILKVAPDSQNISCNIGWNIPGLSDAGKTEYKKEKVISNMLVSMINKVLHRELREAGMIYSIQFGLFSEMEVAELSFSTNANPREVIKKIIDIISHPEEHIKQEDLDLLKRQIKISTIKQTENPLAVARSKMSLLEKGTPIFLHDAQTRILENVTLHEVHEMCARILGQQCSFSATGNQELIDAAPSAKEIGEMYTGQRLEGSVIGWAEPIKETPYDARAVKKKPEKTQSMMDFKYP